MDAAESIAEVLELLGHQVRVAHDGIEALRMARESVPDLALLDIGLPVIDGYELPSACGRAPLAAPRGGERLRAGRRPGGRAPGRLLAAPGEAGELQEIESVVTGNAAQAPEEARPWERKS